MREERERDRERETEVTFVDLLHFLPPLLFFRAFRCIFWTRAGPVDTACQVMPTKAYYADDSFSNGKQTFMQW